jgi:hypothetical protein
MYHTISMWSHVVDTCALRTDRELLISVAKILAFCTCFTISLRERYSRILPLRIHSSLHITLLKILET